jgi:hypothetical protein
VGGVEGCNVDGSCLLNFLGRDKLSCPIALDVLFELRPEGISVRPCRTPEIPVHPASLWSIFGIGFHSLLNLRFDSIGEVDPSPVSSQQQLNRHEHPFEAHPALEEERKSADGSDDAAAQEDELTASGAKDPY